LNSFSHGQNIKKRKNIPAGTIERIFKVSLLKILKENIIQARKPLALCALQS